MLRRWTPKEDKSIAQQLKKGIKVPQIKIPGRGKNDIRKRAYRIGLLVANTPRLEREAARWTAVDAALTAGDKTRKQLVSETGLTDGVMRGVLKRNLGKYHIADWIPNGHRMVPRFALGTREDAPEPGSAAIDSRGDPEAAMLAEARERLRDAEARGELIRRDPFVTALFGQYRPSNGYLASAGPAM